MNNDTGSHRIAHEKAPYACDPAKLQRNLPMTDDRAVVAAETTIRDRMNYMLEHELNSPGWSVAGLDLPWRRSFEVGIGLRDAHRGGGKF